VLPLVIASGPGANARFSIGMTITAGMLVGTLFTLFVLPTFYLPFVARQSAGRAERSDLWSHGFRRENIGGSPAA
jgi:Cu/Ag efflux pump CusA